MMHQRTNRKIIIYLFLFAILTSVNNFKYINPKLFKIDQINISGLSDIENINLYGKFIKKRNDQVINLPFIFGSIDDNNFSVLIKILDKSNFKVSEIDSFYYFKSNRWDIKTKEGLIIRLPSDLNKNLLDKVYQVINDEGFRNIKTIDLRQNNQIITYE